MVNTTNQIIFSLEGQWLGYPAYFDRPLNTIFYMRFPSNPLGTAGHITIFSNTQSKKYHRNKNDGINVY